MSWPYYLWAVFILGGLFSLIRYLLKRREMPRPPQPKWYGDSDDEKNDTKDGKG